MPYRFATERRDYTDYASGRVFYNLPGAPAFPVRLTSEMFQRCQALLEDRGVGGPYMVYDPCCGSAYHLATLAYMQGRAIDTILGSDVDEKVLAVAERNLSLVTLKGLDRRRAELVAMLDQYGKDSHAAALRSLESLRRRLTEVLAHHAIETHLFVADATRRSDVSGGLGDRRVDIVLTDIPYGIHTAWQLSPSSRASSLSPVVQMLEALLPFLSAHTVVAVASDKGQKVRHEAYRRLDRFQIGKRRVVILRRLGRCVTASVVREAPFPDGSS